MNELTVENLILFLHTYTYTNHMNHTPYTSTHIHIQWIKWADGAMIVFSLTDKLSFEDATKIQEDIMRIKNGQFIPLVLCATKSMSKTIIMIIIHMLC